MLFFNHDPKTNQPLLIAGNDVKLEFKYNKHNQLIKLQTIEHNTELSYNLLGEVEQVTQDALEVQYTREPHSYNTTLSFLEQQSITTTHDAINRQTTLTHTSTSSVTPLQGRGIELSYDLKAKTQTISYPNGTQEYYTFNANKDLISLQTAEQNYQYQRDALGRIIKLNDTEYSYDALGQLTQATSTGSVTDFTYDKAGNNLHNKSTYDTSMNTLTEDNNYTYTYDNNGNLKRKIDKQTQVMHYYTWNDFNQLVEHYKASEEDEYIYRLNYSYDGFGRRITKKYEDKVDNNKSFYHHYLYDSENIIAILDQEKQMLASIVHHPTQTDTPLSITNHETNKTYYYHRDHQGSIVALTNEEGQTVEQITYDGHYGKILNHHKTEETHNPYGYTGRETDMDDLYYYRARYYDPSTQRFLSRDPIEFEAGDFNFYRYVGGDPVNFVDPSGLESCECTGLSEKGIDFLKDYEVFKSKMYNDSAGHATIGYGHLIHHGSISGKSSENPFTKGLTKNAATELLQKDLKRYENLNFRT
jgi:RHS repeat-associated protein